MEPNTPSFFKKQWAGEIAQSVKCVLYKHENLNSTPWAQVTRSYSLIIPLLGKQKQMEPWDPLASQPSLSKFNDDDTPVSEAGGPCLQNDFWGCSLAPRPTHRHSHMHPHMHMHTCMHTYKQEKLCSWWIWFFPCGLFLTEINIWGHLHKMRSNLLS